MPNLQRFGTPTLAAGDYTGRQFQAVQEQAKERQAIIEHSALLLNDPDQQLVIVRVPGASSYALPKFVYDAIRRAA